jgi:hypothetical protein
LNEQALREALNTTGETGEAVDRARREALHRLSPDVRRAAARLRAQRAEWRQMILFAACACAFALTSVFASFPQLGVSVGRIRCVLWAGGALMALTLILSPIVAYCVEKEREHE